MNSSRNSPVRLETWAPWRTATDSLRTASNSVRIELIFWRAKLAASLEGQGVRQSGKRHESCFENIDGSCARRLATMVGSADVHARGTILQAPDSRSEVANRDDHH